MTVISTPAPVDLSSPVLYREPLGKSLWFTCPTAVSADVLPEVQTFRPVSRPRCATKNSILVLLTGCRDRSRYNPHGRVSQDCRHQRHSR